MGCMGVGECFQVLFTPSSVQEQAKKDKEAKSKAAVCHCILSAEHLQQLATIWTHLQCICTHLQQTCDSLLHSEFPTLNRLKVSVK